MEIAKHWRLRRQRLSLIGESCPHCATKMFPPRDLCMECGSEAKIEPAFTWKGRKAQILEEDADNTKTEVQVSTPIVTVANS